MALLTKEDVKMELGIDDTENDDQLEVLAQAVQKLFEKMTGRTLEQQEFTEYYSSEAYNDVILLKQRPVASVSHVYEDSSWEFGSDTEVDSDDYTVDTDAGILYSSGFWGEGKNNIKVVYTAGYTELPWHMKQIMAQQAAHWFRLSKEARWDLSSIAMPEGSGTMSFKNQVDGLLPQFLMLVEMERA